MRGNSHVRFLGGHLTARWGAYPTDPAGGLEGGTCYPSASSPFPVPRPLGRGVNGYEAKYGIPAPVFAGGRLCAGMTTVARRGGDGVFAGVAVCPTLAVIPANAGIHGPTRRQSKCLSE